MTPDQPSQAPLIKSVLAVIGFVLSVTNPGHVIAISPGVQATAAAGCALIVAAYTFARTIAPGLARHGGPVADVEHEFEDAWHALQAAVDRFNNVSPTHVAALGVKVAPEPTATPGQQPAQ